MSFLVRKINVSLWPDSGTNYTGVVDIKADAIIKNLRTEQNTLSWWKAENENEAKEIGFSIYSKMDSGQRKIKLVLIPFEDCIKKIHIKNSPENGYTAIRKMKERHYDIYNMSCKDLSILAHMIATATSSNKVISVNEKEALSAIKKYIDEGETDKDLLGDFIKRELSK